MKRVLFISIIVFFFQAFVIAEVELNQNNAPIFGSEIVDNSSEGSFTGDLQLSIPIVRTSLFNLNLNYNSNVYDLVRASNESQISSWVGLGWNFDLLSIVSSHCNTYNVDDDKYFLLDAGTKI